MEVSPGAMGDGSYLAIVHSHEGRAANTTTGLAVGLYKRKSNESTGEDKGMSPN